MLRPICIILFVLAFASVSSHASARPRRAVDPITGNPIYSAAELEERCNQGIQDSCTDFALSLQHGIGIAADTRRAVQVLDNSCNGGGGRSCLFLGLSYSFGTGLEIDETKAINSIIRGCDLSYGPSCMAAAGRYRKEGEMQNLQLANMYSQKSCDLRVVTECQILGEAYYFGLGTTQNYEKAYELFVKGCNQLLAVSCYYQGLANLNGFGVPKSESEAKKNFELALFFNRNLMPAREELERLNNQH